MLTEVRDCDLLIVVTSSTVLERKDILKEKRQLAQIDCNYTVFVFEGYGGA